MRVLLRAHSNTVYYFDYKCNCDYKDRKKSTKAKLHDVTFQDIVSSSRRSLINYEICKSKFYFLMSKKI